jgi:hypothetical protein
MPDALLRPVLLLGPALLCACIGNATPDRRQCPTTAQTVEFSAAGSCGPFNYVYVSTEPGFCDIKASGGAKAGLPETGYFSGTAQTTNYQVIDGNFTLFRGSSDPQSDPSSISCQAELPPVKNGTLLLTCNINACTPSGDEGYDCTQSTCTDTLDPLQSP